jgi:hypothetical protein
MTLKIKELGLSQGQLEAIKLRLLDLPHTTWRQQGCSVVRASMRGDGEMVAEATSDPIAAVIANAPRDLDALVLELEVAREHIAKLKADNIACDRAALEARAECGVWRERCKEMKTAWQALKMAMEANR